jgi:DNA (cytosine-5)-methyltransferase 1
MERKRVVDLFSGCGGLSLGFQNAGFEIIGAFEYWKVAVSCYEQNFKHPVFHMDLSDTTSAINEIKTMSPDVIIGGLPVRIFRMPENA